MLIAKIIINSNHLKYFAYKSSLIFYNILMEVHFLISNLKADLSSRLGIIYRASSFDL